MGGLRQDGLEAVAGGFYEAAVRPDLWPNALPD